MMTQPTPTPAPLDPVNLPAAALAYRAALAAVRAVPTTANAWEALSRASEARRWLTMFPGGAKMAAEIEGLQ